VRTPDLTNNRAGDPGARDATRRACESIVRESRFAFSRTSRPVSCFAQVTARRPKGGQNSPKGQRSRHRLVPEQQRGESSTGARGPSARLGVPVRRIQVAEVGKRRRGSEKRVPGGNGTGGREPRSGQAPKRARTGRKGVDGLHRGGQAAGQAKTGAGRSKGRRGAKVLAVWKTSRAVLPHAPLHAVERGAALAACSQKAPGAQAMLDRTRQPRQEVSEARPHTSRGEDNASRDEGETGGCGPPKRISLA